MAYSAFGTEFAKSYRQWQEDEAARLRAKKARKHAQKVALRGEERRLKRAEEAKVANMMNIIAASKDKSMYEALESSGLSTMDRVETPLPPMGREEKSYAPPTLADPTSREEAALRPKYQDVQILKPERAEAFSSLTPMEVVKRNMPKGDTVEGLREQQQYLSKIMGSERAAAAGPEAIEAAKRKAVAELEADKLVKDDRLAMEIERLEGIADMHEGRRSHGAEREGEIRTARYFGLSGKTFDDWRKDANTRVGTKWQSQELGGEMHNAFVEGQRERAKMHVAAELAFENKLARGQMKSGLTPSNPFNPVDQKEQHDHWARNLAILKLEDSAEKHSALKEHRAKGVEIGRSIERAMGAAEQDTDYLRAQQRFDAYVDSWFPTIPRSRRTPAMVTREALLRGVSPTTALRSAFNRTNPANLPTHRKANYEIWKRYNRGWYDSAMAMEADSGNKVPYSTSVTGMGVQEKAYDKKFAADDKEYARQANRLLSIHNHDLAAIRAIAGVPPEVLKKAEDAVLRPQLGALEQHEAQMKLIEREWDHSMKLSNKAPNTPFIIVESDEVFTVPLLAPDPNDHTKMVRQDLELTHRIRRNPYRALTPRENQLAERERMLSNGFVQAPSSKKDKNDKTGYKLGSERWIRSNNVK